MIRLTPRSVRVRLTLWYVGVMLAVLGVYASAVYTFISDNSSQQLDERLHDDFDWASDMLANRADGRITPYDEFGEGDSPWLQVYSLDYELLYETPEARRNPVPNSSIEAGSGTTVRSSPSPITAHSSKPSLEPNGPGSSPNCEYIVM